MIHCRGTEINRYLAKFVGVMLVEFNPVHTPGGVLCSEVDGDMCGANG